ncbi:GxxExxY protein [Trichloromonas acetexigens]|uniref:GxxExxY protein n=1 Tax=Trichloromonas acetexigens TaxID=38815 RepID=A0A550JHQ9_9BACT|nr:GxxExxY protein [Desulfuromonas acetexigens]TRO82724.1 GxxExxY protein [Desulfuromonas acetexigens]
MLLEDLTQRILKASFQVSNELGSGFLESVYENAVLIALRDEGLRANPQVPLQVPFRGQIVGNFVADVVVEDRVLVELKAVKALSSEHVAQVLNYLKATKIEVGLLINFGNPKLEYRRFNNHFDY